MDTLDALRQFAQRFAGVSLDIRRYQGDWPAPCRVRLITNKNERKEYRLVAYGATIEEAVQNLVEAAKKASSNG